jgi:Cof subfamily protein (haloacid dehalogenase superfamily)
VIPERRVGPIVTLLSQRLPGVWLYRGTEWYVQDRDGPHVDREVKTVEFEPKVVSSYEGLAEGVAKIVGVSDDHEEIATAAKDVHEKFKDHVFAALSQPYYLDLTHPLANKGEVVTFLASHYGIAKEEIATIGDMPNDVEMFSDSGLSIAMGQADEEVKQAAHQVTASNQEEGFAQAVERFILDRPGS